MEEIHQQFNEKEIRAVNAAVGMVLSRPVFDAEGNLLLGSNAEITEEIAEKIQRAQIRKIYVKEEIHQKYSDFEHFTTKKAVTDKELRTLIEEKLGEKTAAPVVDSAVDADIIVPIDISEHDETEVASKFIEKEEFKIFEDTYTKNEEKLANTMKEISDGTQIDLKQLYDLTGNIMDGLKNKGDVFMYLNSIKVKDEYTFSHCANVALLANLFGIWLRLSPELLQKLTIAGALHDIGKTMIPDDILNKKGKLTDEEFAVIKKHTVYGYQVLMKQKDIGHDIKAAALMHHEKLDGTGYPLGLRDDKIETVSKIITICDIYDAMTANRVYRPKICPFDVIRQFEQSSYGLLDTKFLLIFLSNIASNYIGSKVILSDGQVGEVIYINKKELSRPLVRVNSKLVDLRTEKDLKILSVH
jgi:HD-GYP domain-containing protein (c-di-GMP phosphodiesterase class II)